MKVRGEDNPADLFTKHLVGHDRIEQLLKLFGCRFRDGRPKLAPTLRSGKGATKGELLSVPRDEISLESQNHSQETPKQRWCDMEDDEMITWNGYQYPKAIDTDGTILHDIPEAHHATADLLPHLHDDLDSLFPCAQACPPAGDADPPEDTSLGARGWRKGLGEEAPLEAQVASENQSRTTVASVMAVDDASGLPELSPLPKVNIWDHLNSMIAQKNVITFSRWGTKAQRRRQARRVARA